MLEWSTKAHWRDQELWQSGKALIKCRPHVAFKGFCQQESGTFPKPWSMSVILTAGFRNQRKKNNKNTRARSQNSQHICRDLLRLRGLFHCCRGRAAFPRVTTRMPVACLYLHTWARTGASDSFRQAPMFWPERERRELGKPTRTYLRGHKLGRKTKSIQIAVKLKAATFSPTPLWWLFHRSGAQV